MQTPKRKSVMLPRTKFNFQRRDPVVELAAVKESLKEFQKNVRIGKSIINSQHPRPLEVNMGFNRIPTKVVSSTTERNVPEFQDGAAVRSPKDLLDEINNTLKVFSNRKDFDSDLGESITDERIFLRNIDNIIQNYGSQQSAKQNFNVQLDDLREFKNKFHLARTPVKRLRLKVQDGRSSDHQPIFSRTSTPTSDYVEDEGEELYEKFKCRIEQPLQRLRITGSKICHMDIVNGHLVRSKKVTRQHRVRYEDDRVNSSTRPSCKVKLQFR